MLKCSAMLLDASQTSPHMVRSIIIYQNGKVGSICIYTEENKAKIAKSDALRLLVDLARSKDQRVQRNATGALLNMTHKGKQWWWVQEGIMWLTFFVIIIEVNRQHMVNVGAIPVLIGLLSSPDADVQYYCTTALSNIAVDGK